MGAVTPPCRAPRGGLRCAATSVVLLASEATGVLLTSSRPPANQRHEPLQARQRRRRNRGRHRGGRELPTSTCLLCYGFSHRYLEEASFVPGDRPHGSRRALQDGLPWHLQSSWPKPASTYSEPSLSWSRCSRLVIWAFCTWLRPGLCMPRPCMAGWNRASCSREDAGTCTENCLCKSAWHASLAEGSRTSKDTASEGSCLWRLQFCAACEDHGLY